MYRKLMARFLADCRELLGTVAPRRVLEVGCAGGDLAPRLLPESGVRYLGCDVSVAEVAAARARPGGRRFLAASAYRLPFADGAFDTVVACEVFEHLEHPEVALREVERVGRGHLLLSVPWEPVWRLLNLLRGRYWKALGNTPGHVRHYSRAAIRSLVASRFELVAERRPLPWTVLLARRRGADA
ncbi:MAG TPA: class I SAM-dependent methyltransferase [Thermoanaerobaculia bacterium]